MLELQATPRLTLGKEKTRKLRHKECLPAVLYGKGVENRTLQVSEPEVEKILKTKLGKNTYFKLNVEGDKGYGTLIKAVQGDPLTRRLMHVDFWAVDEGAVVEVSVPTRLTGKAPGLLKGGVLDHVSHTVKLFCKATHIPEAITVSVDHLDLNQAIHLEEAKLPEGVKARAGYNPTIVSLTEIKQEVVEVAPTVAVEGEGTAKVEGAAAPGAAAPAAGEAAAKDAKAGAAAKDAKAPAKDAKAPVAVDAQKKKGSDKK